MWKCTYVCRIDKNNRFLVQYSTGGGTGTGTGIYVSTVYLKKMLVQYHYWY